MNRAPSLKALCAAFPSIDPANLKAVRTAIHDGQPLKQLDALIAGFGVEFIHDKRGAAVAGYVNTGDSYSPTFLRDMRTGNIRLTTMGDFVESYERRHAKLL